jgi:PAS domain S-box-containing protein
MGTRGRFGFCVSELKDRLRQNELLLRAVFDGSLDAMLLVDSTGRCRDANPAACEIFRRPREELLGTDPAEFYSPAYDARAVRAELRSKGRARGELTVIRPDGEQRHAEFVVSADIQPGLHLGVLRDVTERHRLEAQLRQAQKMQAIGVLAGGVAHDFNNLLSVILSYTDATLEQLDAEHPVRADMSEVKKAGERAANLTRQLLAFSRRQVLRPAVLHLGEVVAGMEGMIRRLIPEDVALTLHTAPRLGRVHADSGQIEQIIMNLVVNARDAMPRGGRLTIETANEELDADYAAAHVGVTPGPYVMLAVSDTGVGMEPAVRERIFEPFFTTKEKGQGTGLGLSTVYGIVQQSGGHIWVYSEPGQGTAFKIYLPRKEMEPEPVTASIVAATSRARGGETVLLVEDDEQVRVLARTILRRYGYKVLEAQNGGEAFLLCEQYEEPIHVLLTDVVMPGISGKQLADRITPLQPAMKILFMSGYTEPSIAHRNILDAGAALLEKPITRDKLLLALREVLDGPRAPHGG